jgi:hypothetical protein
MGIELPDGWRQQPARARRLEAHPVASPKSGLIAIRGQERPAPAERGEPVELGDHEAWRGDATRGTDGTRTVTYAIPTRSGAVTIECAATPGSAPDTLALCERTASTLQLRGERTVPLATIVNAERRWAATARRLSSDRAAGRRALAAADRQAGQLAASQRLARAYDSAARRFVALDGGAAAARAAREAASAHRAMALAARRDSRTAWAAAVERARAADRELAAAIRRSP